MGKKQRNSHVTVLFQNNLTSHRQLSGPAFNRGFITLPYGFSTVHLHKSESKNNMLIKTLGLRQVFLEKVNILLNKINEEYAFNNNGQPLFREMAAGNGNTFKYVVFANKQGQTFLDGNNRLGEQYSNATHLLIRIINVVWREGAEGVENPYLEKLKEGLDEIEQSMYKQLEKVRIQMDKSENIVVNTIAPLTKENALARAYDKVNYDRFWIFKQSVFTTFFPSIALEGSKLTLKVDNPSTLTKRTIKLLPVVMPFKEKDESFLRYAPSVEEEKKENKSPPSRLGFDWLTGQLTQLRRINFYGRECWSNTRMWKSMEFPLVWVRDLQTYVYKYDPRVNIGRVENGNVNRRLEAILIPVNKKEKEEKEKEKNTNTSPSNVLIPQSRGGISPLQYLEYSEPTNEWGAPLRTYVVNTGMDLSSFTTDEEEEDGEELFYLDDPYTLDNKSRYYQQSFLEEHKLNFFRQENIWDEGEGYEIEGVTYSLSYCNRNFRRLYRDGKFKYLDQSCPTVVYGEYEDYPHDPYKHSYRESPIFPFAKPPERFYGFWRRNEKDGLIEKTFNPKPGERYYGIELELEIKTRGRENFDRKRMLEEYIPVLKSIGFVTGTDGSLGYGIEFRSCPQTYTVLRENLQTFFELVQKDFKVESSCGVHIHVSRESLTDFNIGKVMSFIYNPKNRQFITSIGGRGSGRYQEFMSSAPIIEQESSIYDPESMNIINRKILRVNKQARILKKKDNPFFVENGKKKLNGYSFSKNNKYTALNTLHLHTIEFRLFAGAIEYEIGMQYLEFVDALLKYMEDPKFGLKNLLSYNTFKEWLTTYGGKYTNLCKFFHVQVDKKSMHNYKDVISLEAIGNKKKLKKEEKRNKKKRQKEKIVCV